MTDKDRKQKIEQMFDLIKRTRVEMSLPATTFIAVYSLVKEITSLATLDKDLERIFKKFLKDWEPLFNDLIPDPSLRNVMTMTPPKKHERK